MREYIEHQMQRCRPISPSLKPTIKQPTCNEKNIIELNDMLMRNRHISSVYPAPKTINRTNDPKVTLKSFSYDTSSQHPLSSLTFNYKLQKEDG